MKQRVTTGVILAVVLIPLLFIGEAWFYAAVSLLALIASGELFFLMHRSDKPRYVLFTLWLLTSYGLYWVLLSVYLGTLVGEWLVLSLFVLVATLSMVALFDKSIKVNAVTQALFAILFVAVAFSAISMVRSHGVLVLVYVLMVAMLTDMFAYFVGISFGKRKLAPTVSPKKSVEGAIGGTVIGVAIAGVFAGVFDVFDVPTTLTLVAVLVIGGIFISVMAQIGDLVASNWKREHDVKDFSNLMPGHGGVLDRFDSSVFAAMGLVIVMMILGVF